MVGRFHWRALCIFLTSFSFCADLISCSASMSMLSSFIHWSVSSLTPTFLAPLMLNVAKRNSFPNWISIVVILGSWAEARWNLLLIVKKVCRAMAFISSCESSFQTSFGFPFCYLFAPESSFCVSLSCGLARSCLLVSTMSKLAWLTSTA